MSSFTNVVLRNSARNCQKVGRKESNSRWTICLGFGRYICNCRFTPRQTMSVYANVIDLKLLTFFHLKAWKWLLSASVKTRDGILFVKLADFLRGEPLLDWEGGLGLMDTVGLFWGDGYGGAFWGDGYGGAYFGLMDTERHFTFFHQRCKVVHS